MQSAPPFTWSWLFADGATFFTAALAFIAVCQAVLFVWQLVYMRRTIRDSTTAAGAAQESAKVARESFTKMERPYIYIFGVKGPRHEADCEDPFDYIEYFVANYGKTPAKIEDVRISISIGKSPPRPSPVPVSHDLVKRPILVPGERRDEIPASLPRTIPTQVYTDEFTPPGFDMEPITEGDDQFFVYATIRYRGPFSEGHETSACWRWDQGSARLVEHGGAEYNYTR